MKRNLLLLSTALILFLLFSPSAALACSMKLTPSTPAASVGETITFRLERALTHRNCVLPIEQTQIKVTGGEVVDAGVWKKGNPDVLEFKVRFTQPGDSLIRIERDCSKDGLQTTQTTVKVTGKPASASTPTVTQTATVPSTPTAVPAQSAADPPEKHSRALSWHQALTAWWPAYAEHFWAWLSVFTGGLFLFLGRKHSLRKPLLFVSLLLTGFYLGGCPTPVGSWYYLLTGNRGVFGLVLFLLLVPILLSLFWGRVFCGWMCPLGAVQELIQVKRFRRALPERADQALKKLKYVLLAGFSLVTFWTGINYFGHHEPFKTLFNFDGSTLSFVFLALALAWSFMTSRPFCRYICPLGAMLSITSRYSRHKVSADRMACIHCRLCAKTGCCPTDALHMGRERNDAVPVIDPAECIQCGKCSQVCPRKALSH